MSPTDSPRTRMPTRKPGSAQGPELRVGQEAGAGTPMPDMEGLKTLLQDPQANKGATESAIDRMGADPAAKEALSERIRAEASRFGMSMELNQQEMALIQALVRLQDGPTVAVDGQLTDPQYARYREICAGRVAESVAESTGMAELLDTAIRQILRRNAALLSTPEGIPLGIDRMYAEAVAVIADIDANLPASHPLKGSSKAIIGNFLTPAEDGKKLIRFSVDRLFPSDSHDPESAESRGALYDTMAIAVRGGVATLLDFAQSKDPNVSERMRSVVAQMEKDPNIRAFTEQFPDFLDFFKNAPPQTLQTLDRNKTVTGLDGFLSSCRGDFLALSGPKRSESPEKSQAASLHIANRWAAFLRELITPRNADALVADISRLSAVRKNPMFADLVWLVDESSGLSRADRGMIANRLLEGMERLTAPTIDEKGTFEYFDALLADIGSLSDKIAPDRLDKALASVVRPLMESIGNSANAGSTDYSAYNSQKSDDRPWTDIGFALGNDKMETMRLLWDNKGAIVSYASARVRGETFDTVESVVRFIRENRVIQDNVRAAGWQLATRLRGMVSGNVATEIEKTRSALLRSLPTRIRLPNENAGAGGDKSFQGRLATHVVSETGELLRSKILGGAMDHGGNLTRAELVDTGLASTREFLSKNRAEAAEYLRAAGVVIRPGDEGAFGEFIDRLLAHPRFAAMVEKVVGNAGTRIANASDYASEIRGIVGELATQGADSKLVGPEVRREGLRLSVEMLYDTVTKDPETAKKLFASIGLDRVGALTDKDLLRATTLFVRTVPREAVVRALSPLADKGFEKANLGDLLSAGTGLLKSLPKDRVDALVDELRKQGIIGRAFAGGPDKGRSKPPALSSRDVAEGVKLLYAFRGSVDSETFSWLPQDIAGPLGAVLGKGVDLALRDISPENMTRALCDPESLRLINDAMARRLDPKNPATAERALALANRLYESVPDDRRAKFLASLSESGIISGAMALANSKPAKKLGAAPAVAVTDPMIDHLSRFAYRTVGSFSGPNGAREFSDRFRALTREAMPGVDTEALLATPVLGAPLGENIHAVISCVPQAEFGRILKSHRAAIEGLARGGDSAAAVEGIGVDMALAIDPKAFKKALNGRDLSPMERTAIDSMEAIQSIARDTPDLAGLVREGRTLAAEFARGSLPDRSRISALSGRLFDFVANISTRAPEILKTALAGGGEGGGGDLPVFSFVMSFVRNNFGYVFSNLFSLLFDRPKALSAYFTDASNRANFAATCVECSESYIGSLKKKSA